MSWRPLANCAEAKKFIEEAIAAWGGGTRFAYVLESKSDNPGLLGMLDARIRGHILDFGYVLAKAHWGNEYMPEALQAVSEIALAGPAIFRLQATCDVDNKASARILEKCGYTLEGRHERFVVHPNLSEEPRPCFMYAQYK